MFVWVSLAKDQYIINIHLITHDLTKDIIHFKLNFIPICAHAHWETIVPEFTEFSEKNCHALTLRRKLYFSIFHAAI